MLKLFDAGIDAGSIRHEAEATAVAHDLGLAAPAVAGVVDVDGRAGIAFERLDGPTLLEYLAASPWRLPLVARQMAELQAALHAHTAERLPALRPRLRWQVERVRSLPERAKAAVLEALDRLPDGESILHWDFHPDNIILTARGPFVIDWMGAAAGDPAADLARTCVLIRTSRVPRGRAGGGLGGLALRAFYAAYRRRYMQLRPTSPALVAAWEVPVAAARLLERRPTAENERLMRLVLRGLDRAAQ